MIEQVLTEIIDRAQWRSDGRGPTRRRRLAAWHRLRFIFNGFHQDCVRKTRSAISLACIIACAASLAIIFHLALVMHPASTGCTVETFFDNYSAFLVPNCENND